MKYTTLPYDDSLTHGPVRIIVDKENDIKDLPKDFSAGSKVIVAESGRTYLLNNKQEWKKQPISTGGSGSSSGGEGIITADELDEAITNYMVERSVQSEPEIFWVTVTGTSSTGYVADKPYTEISEAFSSGKYCLAYYSGMIFIPFQYTASRTKFVNTLVNGTSNTSTVKANQIWINSDNTVGWYTNVSLIPQGRTVNTIDSSSTDAQIPSAKAVYDFVSANGLPTVTTNDNGKFLMVQNGAWAAVEIDNAREGEY